MAALGAAIVLNWLMFASFSRGSISVAIAVYNTQALHAGNLRARFSLRVRNQAVQLHGGIGVIEEYKIGHCLRRLFVIDQLFGDSDSQASLQSARAPAPKNTWRCRRAGTRTKRHLSSTAARRLAVVDRVRFARVASGPTSAATSHPGLATGFPGLIAIVLPRPSSYRQTFVQRSSRGRTATIFIPSVHPA
ncbi:hypothetical protein J7E62_31765 [Variovorax paradoxus]|nr:hypothetical protein [Variovorax paradoxus]